MATTIEELLGMNVKRDTINEFPSYEEFQSGRSNVINNSSVSSSGYTYNFNVPQAQPVRSAEAVRNYEANRPYVAPRAEEFNASYNQPAMYQDTYAAPQSLYEFTRRDNDRPSDQELYAKLAHQDTSTRPIFDRMSDVLSPNAGIMQQGKVKEEKQAKSKTRGKLSFKGKLVLGAYIAVVLTVAVLIIANAGKLNFGKATTPSSSIQDYAVVQTLDK